MARRRKREKKRKKKHKGTGKTGGIIGPAGFLTHFSYSKNLTVYNKVCMEENRKGKPVLPEPNMGVKGAKKVKSMDTINKKRLLFL